jgi:hypothetical protein
LSVCRNTCAVNGKKGVGGGKRRPLVAIDQWMVLRQALPESGGFLDQIQVVASLRSVKRGLQKTRIDAPARWKNENDY